MKTIIMAGGVGTRLWPFSRENFPKQFLSLFGRESFLQKTAQRCASLSGGENVFVVTGRRYKFSVENQMGSVLGGKKAFSNIILEPSGRNTAPAIALSMKYLQEEARCTDDEILFFCPSDHLLEPVGALKTAVEQSMEYAKTHIVTFGIKPNAPETGYGYIELGDNGKDEDVNMFVVEKFTEKPDQKTAEAYLKKGNFAWNSGMFLFSIKAMKEEFKKHAPSLFEAMEKMSYSAMCENYDQLESISIDYAVMEKSGKVLCKEPDLAWNDIGSWDAVYDILPHDESGNAIQGRVECIDSKNSLVLSNKSLTSVVGVENIAVIETEDAILVCDRSRAQDVGAMVKKMKSEGRKEATEHATSYRPWGSYTVLEEGTRYKIKRIVVNPGAKLSLQRHRHRSEHWVVIKGMAEIEIGRERKTLHENESVYVPVFEMHRLINPGIIPLEIIEVQNGEYVGEDDIERFEDNYGREDGGQALNYREDPYKESERYQRPAEETRREERREEKPREENRGGGGEKKKRGYYKNGVYMGENPPEGAEKRKK